MNELEQLKQDTTKLRFLGLSQDQRTNRWKVPCPKCGKEFMPRTTMLTWAQESCPQNKCDARIYIDYASEQATLMQEPA